MKLSYLAPAAGCAGIGLVLVASGCGGSVDRERELPAIVEVWDYSDPEGSRARFEELAREAKGAGKEVYRAEVMTQVARTYGLQGRYDEANTLLDEVAAAAAAQHPRVRLRIALERGRVLRSSGDPIAAKPFFEEAWRIGRESGEDFLACDAGHMIAIVVPLDEAVAWTSRSRQVALDSEQDQTRHWLGPLHNNLGWAFYEAGEYESALDQFQLSLEGYRQRENKEVEQLIARYSIGKTLRALGRFEEAVEIQDEIRRAFEARGEDDGYVWEELAEGQAALGRREEACRAAQRAYEILSGDGWFVENEAERLDRIRTLAAECE